MFFAFFLIRQLDFRLDEFEAGVLFAQWNPDGQNNLQLARSPL